MQSVTWHLLTGEYPPAPGGVSDYTRGVARALVAAGDAVEIWAPDPGRPAPDDPGVRVNWLPGNFGPAALAQLDRGLRLRPGPRRLYLQYVPHAFGFKAMNVLLIKWLYEVRRRECIWVNFHEVCFPRYWGQPLKHVFLATVQRWMARNVALVAKRRFVTTPRWITILNSYGHLPGKTEWLPVPSNIETKANQNSVQLIRSALCPNGGHVLGHFGTYSSVVTDILTPPLLAALRKDSRRVALLLGRGGQEYARRLSGDHPDLADRIKATGGLESSALANHLAACDLLLQPFPDGATTRRSSLMASAGLGLPIISSRNSVTERVWDEYAALCFVENSPAAWCDAIDELLVQPAKRMELATNVRRLYADRFSVERMIDSLHADESRSISR